MATLAELLDQACNLGSMDVSPALRKPVVTATSDLDYRWRVTITWASNKDSIIVQHGSFDVAMTYARAEVLRQIRQRKQARELYDSRYTVVRPHIERLLDILLEVKANNKKFDMSRIINIPHSPSVVGNRNVHLSELKAPNDIPNLCGTSACCLGWYCLATPIKELLDYPDYYEIMADRFAPYHPWLFAPQWDDNIDDAILRVKAVLDNGLDVRLINTTNDSRSFGDVTPIQRGYQNELRTLQQTVSTNQ